MKKILFVLLSVSFFTGCGIAQNVKPTDYADLITEQSSREHLTILASKEFAGRGTGQEGGKKAAEYVANYFTKVGLQSGNGQSYFQPVSLVKSSYQVKGFSIGGTPYQYGKDFFVQADNNLQEFNSNDIVFVGYGIQDSKYNDFDGIEVTGKIVILINEGEPKDATGKSLVTGTGVDSEWTKSRLKRLQNLIKLQPAMIIASSSQVQGMVERYKNRLTAGRISLKKSNANMTTGNPPIVMATEAMVDKILSQTQSSISDIKNKISTEKRANSFVIKTPVTVEMGNFDEDLNDPNVLGFLEGSDLKDEIVVVGGHYDHDGIDASGTIFPGADDNGTGTVAVMELANAFAKAKKDGKGPRRSILFITYAAEEKGLLGSSFYTENPIYPLDNTVACLNIDMIGRIDDIHIKGNHNYIHVIGTNKLSSELNPIVEKANDQYTQMTLDSTYNDPADPMRLYYRSDHYNFAKKGIPSLFFFSGLHPHYHTPEDTVDKIDFPMFVKREKLIFYVTWDIANRDKKLVVDIPETATQE